MDGARAGGGRAPAQVFRTPEGQELAFNSRWARKGLGLRKPGAKGKTGFFSWKPGVLSWWVAVHFTLGSLFFVVGGVVALLDAGKSGVWLDFVGSVGFSIGAYLQVLEALNRPMVTGQVSGSDGAASLLRPRADQFRWWTWRPLLVDSRGAVIQCTAALFFQVNTLCSLFSGGGWVREELLVWGPSCIGSAGFVWSTWLFLVEAGNGRVAWSWSDIGWRSVMLNLLGSIGFLAASLLGFFGDCPLFKDPVALVNWVFLTGSVLFLVGSYLGVVELSWQPVRKAVRSRRAATAT